MNKPSRNILFNLYLIIYLIIINVVSFNYYLNDDPNEKPIVRWRSHANLLYSNWLNYFVYQETPYDIENIH